MGIRNNWFKTPTRSLPLALAVGKTWALPPESPPDNYEAVLEYLVSLDHHKYNRLIKSAQVYREANSKVNIIEKNVNKVVVSPSVIVEGYEITENPKPKRAKK